MHAYKIKPRNNLATVAKRLSHGNHATRMTSMDRLVAAIRENDSLTDKDCRRLGFTDSVIARIGPTAVRLAREQSERGVGA